MNPIKFAIAGFSHDHVDWFFNRCEKFQHEEKKDLELVGIWEPNPSLRRKYAKLYQLKDALFFEDLEELLESKRPQAVCAFGSISDHLRVAKACASRKIHVLVEKPLAANLKEAREIQKLALKHSIHVLTNFETSWYASVQHAMELIKRGKLGSVNKVVINCGSPGPQEQGASSEFLEILKDPQKNGAGALFDYACYGANLALYFLGGRKPDAVAALLNQNKPEIYQKVDDEATLVLQYPKTQVIIQASWNFPFVRKDFEIYGDQGYVKAFNGENGSQKFVDDGSEQSFTLAPRPEPFNDPFSFLAAVINGQLDLEPNDLYGLSLNMGVMEILETAKESAKQKRTISL